MKVGGEDDSKNSSWDRNINPREVSMKYCRLAVFIRNDSTEIWEFRCGLTLVIGALKIMASTGVFVRVVCALKQSISSFPCSLSTIFT
jgi:hypothetical protein